MALIAFLPFLVSLGLVMFFALGWRRERRRLDELKERRVKLHCMQRAQLAAQHFEGFTKIQITGVLPDEGTLLIGYRKPRLGTPRLFPGERITDGSNVEGTIIGWPSAQCESLLRTLNAWLVAERQVYLRVSEGGSSLILCEPETDEVVAVGLIPSGL